MGLPATEYLSELEEKTYYYLGQIRRIDSILEGPVRTLIRLAMDYTSGLSGKVPVGSSVQEPQSRRSGRKGFPVWMSDYVQPEPEDDLFSKTLCFTTLQTVATLQRRFSWLRRRDREDLHNLFTRRNSGEAGGRARQGDPAEREGSNALIESLYIKSEAAGQAASLDDTQSSEFRDCVRCLSSKSFGALNPLTASQVFHVLLNDGEREAHGALGFLAFFAMIWPLYRRFPDQQRFGAAIEPWEPKAYVTAKCILPIKTLQSICTERAGLLRELVKILERLDGHSGEGARKDAHKRWLFCAELETLRARILRLSSIVIAKEELREHARRLREAGDELSQDREDNRGAYEEARCAVGEALRSIGVEGVRAFVNSKKVVYNIGVEIVNRLKNPTKENLRHLSRVIELKFAGEYMEHPDGGVRGAYLKDLADAAEKSWAFCNAALEILGDASESCSKVQADDFNDIAKKAEELALANTRVAGEMDEVVRHATAWCRVVVDHEIAHASAQNLTDFDPSELVSAIAVAVRWNQITTTLQVSDAVSKSLAGARSDGSWSPGQPFYSPNNAMGVWPVTSDTVLTLADILNQHPEVEVADEALFRYVDWLELTKTELKYTATDGGARAEQPAFGWASDRLRHWRKIHFPTSAFSICALLRIRDLIEYRLWQLCEKRFTVITGSDGLQGVTPVDLGAQHRYRLHRHLAWMAEAQSRDYEDAEYSLVLHGPPGSSKTFIAKALSVEMWNASRPLGAKNDARLVRITPADFTRLGEDRLDSEARLIFELISGLRKVTIFFDEIDDLLRERNTDPRSKPTFMELIAPAMLNRLADLRDACPRQEICFLLATNYVDSIEPALVRKGRVDRAIPVVYPDQESRVAIISDLVSGLRETLQSELDLKGKTAARIIDERCRLFAAYLAGWPYLTIKSATQKVIKELEEAVLSDSLVGRNSGTLRGKGKRAWKVATKDIPQLIREFDSGLTKPSYEERLNISARPELLDEYAHFIISNFKSLEDASAWINRNTTPGQVDGTQENLERRKVVGEKIEKIINEQRRWVWRK